MRLINRGRGRDLLFSRTDSAPHPIAKKLSINGIPAFSMRRSVSPFTQKCSRRRARWTGSKAFASLHGPAHYGLSPNQGTITLDKWLWTPIEQFLVPGPDEKALVHHGGERLEWQVVG
jgi:dihydroorotase